MEGLIEGRIIHYVAFNNRHLAGIVIGVNPMADPQIGNIDIGLFTNMVNVNGVKNFGLQFHQEVLHSDDKTPGTWHWIERN